jgi:hypothetical protein
VRHTKIGSEYLLPSNDVAIAAWRGVRQLQHLSLSISKEWFSAATAYAGDTKTETIVLLDESVFDGADTCAIDVWLLDRSSESKLFAMSGRQPPHRKGNRLIAEVVAALDAFPDHKIGLTMRAPLTRESQSEEAMP